MTVTQDSYRLGNDAGLVLIEMYTIDLSPVGGGMAYFTSQNQGQAANNAPWSWGGNIYVNLPFESSGWERSSKGALPRPRLKMANIGGEVSALLTSFGDLIGCTVTRNKTYTKYLDQGSTPDVNAHYQTDVYRLDRKSAHTRIYIEWELSASLDQQSQQLPGRQVLRDYCSWTYRVWDPLASAFDYSKAVCPYAGVGGGFGDGPYFDENNNNVGSNPQLDRCSKKISGCKIRFEPAGVDLPFAGFPSVSGTGT